MTPLALRQTAWNAAFAVLDGNAPDAYDQATLIADAFNSLRELQSARRVPEETREAIKADLMTGYYSYAEIRDRNGVGTSTVQGIARELRAKGVTVNTIGRLNNGRRFTRNRQA